MLLCNERKDYTVFRWVNISNDNDAKEIAQILNYDITTCRVALEQANITHDIRKLRHDQALYKPILQLDKNTEEIIAIFPSIGIALRSLGKQHSGHIAAVCNGKQKTAYGYKWRYASA